MWTWSLKQHINVYKQLTLHFNSKWNEITIRKNAWIILADANDTLTTDVTDLDYSCMHTTSLRWWSIRSLTVLLVPCTVPAWYWEPFSLSARLINSRLKHSSVCSESGGEWRCVRSDSQQLHVYLTTVHVCVCAGWDNESALDWVIRNRATHKRVCISVCVYVH